MTLSILNELSLQASPDRKKKKNKNISSLEHIVTTMFPLI